MQILVFGAGTMGHSLAFLFAWKGHTVTLADISEVSLEQASARITRLAENLHLHMESADSTAICARIRYTADGLSCVSNVDMVVEAIAEQTRIKQDFYAAIAPVLPEKAILASNTSVLNIFDHAPKVLHSRMIMTHYFVPPHLVPLVEVVGHPSNPPELLSRVVQFLEEMDMTPVVLKKFVRGFIINRIQRAINQEIFQLIDDGVADPSDIDRALAATLGMRLAAMGYLERCDHTGLDLLLANYKQTPLGLVTDESPPALLQRMVDAGLLGFKNGKGFYDYSGRNPEEDISARDARLIAMRRFVRQLDDAPIARVQGKNI